MWRDDDFEYDEDDVPLIEIELDDDADDEDGGRGPGNVLRYILIAVIVLALAAAAFLVIRHMTGGSGRQSSGQISVQPTTDSTSQSGGAGIDDDMILDEMTMDEMTMEDMSIPDDMREDGMEGMEGEVPATPEPTPVPTPTPTPAPAIPEQYIVPGLDMTDLEAVHDYIQNQLNAMAADVNYPNVDSYTVNDDCTVFTAVCNSVNESLAERDAAETMYEFGRMYAACAGRTAGNIHIDYVNQLGGLLWTRDSDTAG